MSSHLPQAKEVERDLESRQLDFTRLPEIRALTGPTSAVAGLPIYRDGRRCTLNPAQCGYVCRSEKGLRKHWKDKHQWTLCEGPGRTDSAKKGRAASRLQLAVRQPVLCQRLFLSGVDSHFFEVTPQSPARPTTPKPFSTKALMLSELVDLENAQQLAGNILIVTSSDKEVSPWLQLTRWPGYLADHSLRDVARLAWPLSKETDGEELAEICNSLNRLVEAAITAVREDRINPFDEMRINSFLQRPRASDKPLAFKLQKSTFRSYKNVWKRLLCFVYRTMQPTNTFHLRHSLSSAQVIGFAELLHQISCLRRLTTRDPATLQAIQAAQAVVDDQCLAFCVSLSKMLNSNGGSLELNGRDIK